MSGKVNPVTSKKLKFPVIFLVYRASKSGGEVIHLSAFLIKETKTDYLVLARVPIHPSGEITNTVLIEKQAVVHSKRVT